MNKTEPLIKAETEIDIDSETNQPQNAEPASRFERWILYVISSVVIILDQWSKNVVRSNLDINTYFAPLPEIENIFRISHVTNTGMAFGLFPGGSWLFTLLAPIVSIAIIIYNHKLELGNRLLRVALGLQLGGAVGNLIDRLTQGYVTDFMDFGPWPVWNIADLAVVTGTVLLAFVLFQEEREAKNRMQLESQTEDQADDQPDPIR
jgi:signal peptidase II